MSHAPIAIVGMGCRYPGGATSPQTLWKLLVDGVDAVDEIPRDRFDVDALYHPVPGTPGRMNTRRGAFIADHDRFDAGFFGISPREAERMDPQQRLLLEVLWETFEDAGMPPEHAATGERTGVYLGMMEAGYESLLFQDPDGLEVLGLNGAGRYGTAGRLSHAFRLSGPCLSVDTACSSSLVSVHLAVQSLRAGECTLAVAGGAHLLLQPQVFLSLAQGSILAPDGRCKFGDESADGFGRGEGVGLVLLQPLARALAEGRKVYAVIRGGAVGSYGVVDGAMARPSAAAQEANTRAAYLDAGVPPSSVQYVECHGTGTRAGDGTELKALGAVLASGRAPGDRCGVGSIKTNLAHLEGASGVAGLMKLALSLHHRYLPPSLHVRTPNPKIPWAELPVELVREGRRWPEPTAGERRVGGINSFGMSGTNAHLVLEEAPTSAVPAATTQADALLVWSAPDSAGLARVAAALAPAVGGARLAEVEHTLAARRGALPERAAVVVSSTDDAVAALRAAAAGQASAGSMRGRAAGRPRVAFVFSGHGSQWLGMGRDLLASSAVFRRSLEATDAELRRQAGWSLLDELDAPPERSRLALNEVVQPVLFGVAVALAAQWRAWGVEPDAVVGHSMGEIAAAHVAGALTLADGVRIVAERSRLLARVVGHGGMLLVELSEREVQPLLDDDVALAVIQSSRACVLSGTRAGLAAVEAQLERRGVYSRWVKVDYASHGPQVAALRDDLRAALAPITPRAGSVPIESTYLGRTIRGDECDAEYWYQNLRQPVRFAGAIAQLAARGVQTFVELSPHPLLSASIAPEVPGSLVVPSGRRDEPMRKVLLESLGALWCRGQRVEWSAVSGPQPAVPLPGYPFDRQRYWFTPATPAAARRGHPLLGPAVSSSLDPRVTLHEAVVGPGEPPFLRDHAVQGAVVLPGVAYVELARAAAKAQVLEDVVFEAPLVLGEPRALQLALVDDGARGATFTASSRAGSGPWQRHCTGRVARAEVLAPAVVDRASLQARLSTHLERASVYTALAALGLEYGPAFQGIVELWHTPGEALARVSLPDTVRDEAGMSLHPALLDACLQALVFALDLGPDAGPMVPAAIARIELSDAPLSRSVWASTRVVSGVDATGEVTVFGDDGRVLLRLRGVTLVELERRVDPALYLRWDYVPQPAAPVAAHPGGPWFVLGAPAAPVARALAAAGQTAELLTAERLTAVLERASGAGVACRGVVWVGAPELPADPSPEALLAPPLELLQVAQALLAARVRDVPRLYLVTVGAHGHAAAPSAETATAAVGAAVLGLGRVLAAEHAQLAVTRIDVGERARLDELAPVLLAGHELDELVVDARGVSAVQLTVGRTPSDRGPSTLRADRSYLITGGLGGLGLELARGLARRGARHLVLCGRSGGAAPELGPGVSVRVARVDVADRAAVTGLIASIQPPLAGVFHAAGVLDDGLVEAQTPARYRAVLAPKVLGAWNLHQATRDLPLDSFVLYGSAAALIGTPGQTGYAAGNGFLDGLAMLRRAHGRPGLSIAWGAFADVGLAATDARRGDHLRARGFGSLRPAESVRAIAELLADGPACIGVVRFDARQWLDFHPQLASSSYFARLAAGERTAAPAEAGRRLRALEGEARREGLVRFIRGEAARVLRLEADRIGLETPLRGAGFDSLMGLELRNRLESGLGLRLPATLLWVHPTVRALADHLGETLAAEARADTPPPAPHAGAAPEPQTGVTGPAEPLEQRLSGLTEQEKLALLEATLLELE